MDRAQVLAASPLLAGAPQVAIDELTAATVLKRFKKGEFLCRQGEAGDSILIVVDGAVKLTVASIEGDETVLTVLSPGESFGELAALDGGPRSATAIALSPTAVLLVPARALTETLRRHPSVAHAVLRSVIALVRTATDQRCDLVFRDLAGRVCHALARRTAPNGMVKPQLTQTELAQLVGGTRQTINQVLGQLDAAGVIAIDGRAIRVLDIAELRRRAQL